MLSSSFVFHISCGVIWVTESAFNIHMKREQSIIVKFSNSQSIFLISDNHLHSFNLRKNGHGF